MNAGQRPPLTTMRLLSAVVGIGVIWITVLVFTSGNPVDLTVALLVVLAEVLAVAVLAGPLLSVVSALASVVLVNWYLVPPYGTFQIASTDNVVSLVVFTLVAAVAASLMEIGSRARARAIAASQQTELLGDVLTAPESADAGEALQRVRTGLGLDYVELRRHEGPRPDALLASNGTPTGAINLDIDLPDGYRLIGHGGELLAPDPDFLVSLGSAAARAYESEQLRAETERANELASIDRARTALLASVGHDLRTPLASLRVSVDALRSPGPGLTDEDRQTLMATLGASTDRLDELITNLLDMSRLEAGVVIATLSATDLGAVIDKVELAVASDRLVVDVPRAIPPVSADPALLERVVANLVSNAMRYSPPGTPIELAAHLQDGAVDLSVSDRGPGITSAESELVFTPFHRVGAQADGGSGLGLAIVRGFAEAMGMTVSLTERVGGGLSARVSMRPWSDTR